MLPFINDTFPTQKVYKDYIERNTLTYAIFAKVINQAIITDVCSKRTAKEI